jgi:hypothetical protein
MCKYSNPIHGIERYQLLRFVIVLEELFAEAMAIRIIPFDSNINYVFFTRTQ